VFDLASGGVGYATSGGFVDGIADQIDAFARRITSGQLVVPTTP
jgi:basic membrane protein A and related proteins